MLWKSLVVDIVPSSSLLLLHIHCCSNLRGNMFLMFSFVLIRSFGSMSILEKRHLVANSPLLFPCGYMHRWNLDLAHLCIRFVILRDGNRTQ